jgi:hypothetical protein
MPYGTDVPGRSSFPAWSIALPHVAETNTPRPMDVTGESIPYNEKEYGKTKFREIHCDSNKRSFPMNPTYLIIAVVLVLVIVGAILGAIFSRRNRSKHFQNKFGPEYDRTVQSAGNEKKAQAELNERGKHVDTLNIRPLSIGERERYQAEWTAIQAKFVDQPGQATVEADHLIMDVMKVRAYPVSDFEQRAADISVNYPALVSNYRAAREIAIKNEQHSANTEELRQAMIHYRSLFDELLKEESVNPERR